ncbi:MAG: hypothetical protein KBA71_07515 [Opitutaceae bacterium]|nr:hypothetical protein [Opitutaceae bacterium]
MEVVPITLIISLWLVLVFVIFFLQEHARGRTSSAERDSLLPLADETPRLSDAATTSPSPPALEAQNSAATRGPGSGAPALTRTTSGLSDSHS